MARYLKIFLLSAMVTVIGIAAINGLVDPYRLFRIASWPGINRVKPYANHEQRLAKAYLAEWVGAKALILGNSRAEIGFDPAHPAWPAQPVLNLAVAGTSLELSLAYLRHAAAVEKPDVVVLGVDFMDFLIAAPADPPQAQKAKAGYSFSVYPDGRPNPYYHWRKWQNRFDKTVSLNAFLHSLGTVYYQNSLYSEDLTELGFNPMRDYKKIVTMEGYYATFKQRDVENAKRYARGPREIFWPGQRRSPVFDLFREIVRFCDAQGIRLIVVIYPYHAHLLETLNAAGLWPVFEDWKRELAAILEQTPAKNDPLWDFSGYNRFTTEPVPAASEKNREVKWYWEAGHFKKELGDVVLSRLFGSRSAENPAPEDFGVSLTSGNIEKHLAGIRERQARYQSEYSEDLANIKAWIAAH
jgi:hypothetical protein